MNKDNLDRAVQAAVMLLVFTLAYLVVSLTAQVSDLNRDIKNIDQRLIVIEYMEMYGDEETEGEE